MDLADVTDAASSRAFGGRGNKGNNNTNQNQNQSQNQQQNQQQNSRGPQAQPNGSYRGPPSPAPPSPSTSSTMSWENINPNMSHASLVSQGPPFFREEYAGLIVKGNFMTLAAKPVLVETGEWIAHQVVEQYRLLDSMIKIVQEIEPKTRQRICNPQTCPRMSAGSHTYAWLDHNKKPVQIPALQYITYVQKWIAGRINDPNLFPTDTSSSSTALNVAGGVNNTHTHNSNAASSEPAGKDWLGRSSGFPENFEREAKNMYRQMFRLYAHLYHGHWLDPFYHIDAYRELNTCFVHFMNVGRLFDLFMESELEPMQPLIDIWITNGQLPATAAATPSSATSATSTG